MQNKTRLLAAYLEVLIHAFDHAQLVERDSKLRLVEFRVAAAEGVHGVTVLNGKFQHAVCRRPMNSDLQRGLEGVEIVLLASNEERLQTLG